MKKQTNEQIAFGESVLLYRRRNHIRSTEFAKRHGISRATLWRIEAGKSESMPISLHLELLTATRLSTIQEVEENMKSLWADELNGDYTEEEKKNPLVAYNAALQQVKQVLASMRKGGI